MLVSGIILRGARGIAFGEEIMADEDIIDEELINMKARLVAENDRIAVMNFVTTLTQMFANQ